MATYSKESLERIEKLDNLRGAGVIPYANKFNRTHNIEELKQISESEFKGADELMANGASKTFSVAGRLMLFRSHGKLSFGKIRDGHGDIQLCFMKGVVNFNTGREVVQELNIGGQDYNAYKIIEKFFDIGDFVAVSGDLFVTKHGETTLFINEFQMMAKAIRPLPEKFHGINDIETLYRQRYLDLTMHDDTYERFKLRSKFVKVLRDFYDQHDFLEIETPVMGNAASGAAAAPFQTHHNDFDEDYFLRISPETNLKKATVGRFERVFEIGKQFRNEGSDPSHLQEFTSVEHYAAYWNFEDNMKFTEDMFDYIFENTNLKKEVEVKDKQGNAKIVNFQTPWERIDYVEGVKKESGINIEEYGVEDEQKLREDIKAKGIEFEGMDKMGTPTLIDYLFKKVLRPKITGPAFVYNYPKTMQPLARVSDDDNNIVEQYQVVVNGWEVIKAYSELVDPILQQQNFDDQAGAIAKGDEEATAGDNDFVLAMEYGMPPQSGWGMGIDRIFTLLVGQENLRDGVLFPLMKSEKSGQTQEVNLDQELAAKPSGNTEKAPAATGVEKEIFENLPTIQQANDLIEKYATETKMHLKSVGYVMRYFAAKLGQDEDAWQLVGMLHDIDWDHVEKNADRHCKEDFENIVNEINLPQALIRAIKSHAHFLVGVEPQSLLEKYICATDELTGFITAVVRVMPNKSIDEVKIKSVKKKIKDKSFARGVDRTEVKNCETMLGSDLGEFIEEIVEALKLHKEELGI